MASYGQGTVTPASGFNAEASAGELRKAMKGIGTDEATIIKVLSTHSNQQRQEMNITFKTLYGKDLKKELKSELGGKFEDVILGLMETPINYDAHVLRDAIKGAGTDEMALIEILCTRSNAEIEQIKSAYKTLFKDNLEKDVMSDTGGTFERLLVSQLTANRDESGTVDQALAVQEAAELFKAGAGKVGTDESTFNRIFSMRSYQQLRATFDAYRANHKKEIEAAIKSEFSGYAEEGLLAIAKCARSVPGYFAERLYSCMKGAGTKDKVLIRVIVSRCEVDMVQIKEEFQRKYGKSLGSFIKGDTSGDYKKILMALCKEA